MRSSPAITKMGFAVTVARKKKRGRGAFLVVSIWILVKYPAIHQPASNPQALCRWRLGVSLRWHTSQGQEAGASWPPGKCGSRRAASGEGAATALATQEEDWRRGKSTLPAWTSQPNASCSPSLDRWSDSKSKAVVLVIFLPQPAPNSRFHDSLNRWVLTNQTGKPIQGASAAYALLHQTHCFGTCSVPSFSSLCAARCALLKCTVIRSMQSVRWLGSSVLIKDWTTIRIH